MAQGGIETRLCYSDTTAFTFTSEWQYLSTDIYLFNGEKFSNVVNELSMSTIGSKKRNILSGSKKGLTEERLEFLFITAQLQNVRFFGDKEIVYPLYNFQINTDKDQKYKTLVSDNIPHIRIIDNLPLYSASDQIDAKINVRAVSQSDRDQIVGFIGSQLRLLARDANPVGAVFSLIGEFGSFMESSSRKKEYQFSSTIRLFEQKNFDTRLHSIKVYQLVASNQLPDMPSTDGIAKLLSAGAVTDLTRKQLEEAMGYKDYPYIVVANYKSLYRMEEIKGDEVSLANIDKRKYRIENSFRNGLINEDTYKQEKDFINFLAVFANLKTMLELYNMNFKMGNIDAASNSLASIAQQYRTLSRMYEEAEFKYKENNTFKNVFRSEYLAITDYADLYLDADHNLKAVKAMMKTTADLQSQGVPKGLTEVEESLRRLSFSKRLKADFLTQTQEGQTIAKQVQQCEQLILERTFAQDILRIMQAKATPESITLVEELKDKVAKTNCASCRDQALEVIREFYQRYDSYQRTEVLKRTDKLKKQAEEYLIRYSTLGELVGSNAKQKRGKDSASIAVELMRIKADEVIREVEMLHAILKDSISNRPLSMINAYNEKVTNLMLAIEEHLTFINTHYPELLREPAPVIIATEEPVSVSTDSTTVQQVGIQQKEVLE